HTRFSRDWSSDVCSSDLAMNLSFSSSHGPVLGRIPMAELVSTRGGAVDDGRILVDSAWQEYLARRDAREPYEFEASFIRADSTRSEERRVGKEGTSRGAA